MSEKYSSYPCIRTRTFVYQGIRNVSGKFCVLIKWIILDTITKVENKNKINFMIYLIKKIQKSNLFDTKNSNCPKMNITSSTGWVK